MKAFPPLFKLLRCVRTDRRGAAAVEYALMVAGIMLVIFAALSQLGISLQNVANFIATHLNAATS